MHSSTFPGAFTSKFQLIIYVDCSMCGAGIVEVGVVEVCVCVVQVCMRVAVVKVCGAGMCASGCGQAAVQVCV